MNRILVLIAVLALSATAEAQQSRDGKWEFGLTLGNLSGETVTGLNGSFIDSASTTAYGLSVGYNFSKRLALTGEILWGTPNYTASLVPENAPGTSIDINHEMDLFNYGIKGTFNLLEGPVTPFIEAGLGWTYFDSNVADSAPVTGCWWDPFRGYVCDTFYSTYSKTQEYYGAAGGLRWDLNNAMSLKGSYGMQEIKIDNAAEDLSLEVWRLEVLWRF
jgi:hypothetical protein